MPAAAPILKLFARLKYANIYPRMHMAHHQETVGMLLHRDIMVVNKIISIVII